MSDLLSLAVRRHAVFSPCRRWRYYLSIIWDMAGPALPFVMLNPSTADEVQNDPTVSRCERRARMMGYGGLIVVNAFGWRDTEPKNLKGLPDPVGENNDLYIHDVAKIAGQAGKPVICGWGTNCDDIMPSRGAAVLAVIRAAGAVPHALKVNADGSPQHPLYLSYDLKPAPMV